MSLGKNVVYLITILSFGIFIACSSISSPPESSDGGQGGSSSSSSSSSSSCFCSMGCGGGCLSEGECYSKADCGANDYCRTEECFPVGHCTPISNVCPGVSCVVCGCGGVLYQDACTAAQAGVDVHLSVTECGVLPAGKLPCGSGFCDLANQYCRQGTDGTLACATRPLVCATDPSCGCLSGNIDCDYCFETKGGGALATMCGG